MSDIVERLKDAEIATHALFNHIFQDAREEIERLREGYARLRDAGDLEMGDGDLARQIASEMLAP